MKQLLAGKLSRAAPRRMKQLLARKIKQNSPLPDNIAAPRWKIKQTALRQTMKQLLAGKLNRAAPHRLIYSSSPTEN